jgi:hypothetical protein
MAKPIKIRDPKLRALLATVRGKRKTVGRKKSSKKAPKSQVNFYADKARALEAELRRMRERAAAAPQAMRKLVRKAKKVGKRTATQALRVPSLPADHPFNRPRRKAAKKRAKKASRKPRGPAHLPPELLRDLGFATPKKRAKKRAKTAGKRTATQALRVPSLPADHPFNRPRKAAKKRAKKSVKRKTQVFHVKRSKKVAKKSVKRKTQVFHVKRSKKVAKKSKRTAKRVR